MKTLPPLVSVVVPTFNSCERMRPTLDSLAAQTDRDFEVIVSDGASSEARQQARHR